MSIYKEQFDKLHTSVSTANIISAAENRKKKKRLDKAVVVPIVVAAAMSLGVVSVGASCGWNFKAFTKGSYLKNRHESVTYNETKTGTEQEHFMYGDTVTVPEGMQEYHEMTDKEHELFDRLSVDVNETLEFDDLNFRMDGIIFDGYILRMQDTIINNSGVIDEHNDDKNFYITIDHSLFELQGMNGGLESVEKDRVTWTNEWYIPESEDLTSLTFVINKRGETVNGYTGYPERGRITVELPDASGLSRTYKLDAYTRLGDYGESHIKKARFSPLGIYYEFDFNFDGRFKDTESIHIGYPPVYITMNDGAVIAFQNTIGSGGGRGYYGKNDDGSFMCYWQISQDNYLIDAFDIASVQIGNEVIELDDSMVIDE